MILRFRNVRFVSQVQLFRNSYSSPPSSSTFSLVSGIMSSSFPPASSRPGLFLPLVSNHHNSFTSVPQKTNTPSRWVSFSRLLAPLPTRSPLIPNCWLCFSAPCAIFNLGYTRHQCARHILVVICYPSSTLMRPSF